MDKKFLYYPSLSAGSMQSAFKKDMKFTDGTTMKFYSKEYPEEWQHPYFLITAGHHYKKMDFRKRIGLDDDVLVFGDSGGFQIATGTLKWDLKLREQIFHWLEENSDIAANIDIPPHFTYQNRFHEAMDLSFDNFKWFEKHQSGKTKFLNVLQGTNPNEFVEWYDKFQDFSFNGWAMGGPRKLVNFIYSVALMLQRREWEKPHNQYVHFLGISKITDFFILATIQKLMNKLTNNRILVSTDSSSPGQYPVFGTYLHSGNYKTQSFTELYFPKNAEYRRKTQLKKGKGETSLEIDLTKHVPCSLGCPACKDFTYEYLGGKTDAGLDRYTQEAMPRMVLHNTHLYVKIANEIADMTDSHVELLETVLPNDLYAAILSLHEMFEDPDNAFNVFERYKKMYAKFGGEAFSTINANKFNEYFKF